MKSNFINLIKKLAEKKNNRKVSLFFICTIVLMENKWFGQEYFKSITNGLNMIDMSFFNRPSQISSYLATIGGIGREAYLLLLALDFLLVISFFLLQSTMIIRLLKKWESGDKLKWLWLLPFGRGIFDVIENICMICNTLIFPHKFNLCLSLASIATVIKWVFFWITIIVLITLIIVNLVSFVKQKVTKKTLQMDVENCS